MCHVIDAEKVRSDITHNSGFIQCFSQVSIVLHSWLTVAEARIEATKFLRPLVIDYRGGNDGMPHRVFSQLIIEVENFRLGCLQLSLLLGLLLCLLSSSSQAQLGIQAEDVIPSWQPSRAGRRAGGLKVCERVLILVNSSRR